MPLIFLRLLIAYANFVLISLFYADLMVAQPRLPWLSGHCRINTVRTTNPVLEDWQ
jgi:hypothetical protein